MGIAKAKSTPLFQIFRKSAGINKRATITSDGRDEEKNKYKDTIQLEASIIILRKFLMKTN